METAMWGAVTWGDSLDSTIGNIGLIFILTDNNIPVFSVKAPVFWEVNNVQGILVYWQQTHHTIPGTSLPCRGMHHDWMSLTIQEQTLRGMSQLQQVEITSPILVLPKMDTYIPPVLMGPFGSRTHPAGLTSR
jgi:hypothetical protein